MSKEMRHQPDLKPFVGQWVVLLNDAVIEHGEELASIVERARARGIRCPRVLFVEPQQKRVVMLGL
jgi:hypothetical protein